jgi:transposase
MAIQKQFVRLIQKTIRRSTVKNDIVLFLDPVHQVHNVDNSYCWQLTGRSGTKTVLSNSGRDRLTIIGALNPMTQKTTILTTEGNCDQFMMIAFLAEVRKEYPDTQQTVHVFLDNARYNHARLVTAEATKLGIMFKFLPPYSPNLNLIERLWKFMKKKVTANKYYKTFGEFTKAIDDFFKNIATYQAELATLLTLKFEVLNNSYLV